jgi:hypothetical protein
MLPHQFQQTFTQTAGIAAALIPTVGISQSEKKSPGVVL